MNTSTPLHIPFFIKTCCPTSFDICGSNRREHTTTQAKQPKANKLLAHSHTSGNRMALLQFLAWPKEELAAKRNYLLLSSQMAGRVFVGKAAFVMMMKNVKASKSANGKRCIVTGVLLPLYFPVKRQKDCLSHPHYLSLLPL